MIGSQIRPSIVAIGADRLFTKAEPVATPAATFTVSARSKPRDMLVYWYEQ